MHETSMNIFDLGVLLIVGLSALLSFFRGFVREMMSLGAWVIASVVSLKFLEPASHLIEPQVKSAVLATGIAAVSLFFITLVLISIVTGLILKFLKPGDKVGLFDNLVGLCFGVARGVLIVAIIYFTLTKLFFDEKKLPDWMKHAMSRPYVATVAHGLGTLTPDYLDAIMNKKKEGADEGSGSEEFGEDAKKKMDQLIESLDKKAATKKPARQKEETIDEDLPESSLPSMEDLQRRIREENEKK